MNRRQDFVCLSCDLIVRDAVIPSGVATRDAAPLCPQCDVPLPMEWLPQTTALAVFGDNQKFVTTVDDATVPGGQRRVEIDSLTTIRRLERESEQAERNGEGRRHVWRDFSQDRSNTDVHTLGADPSQKPPKFLSNGLPVVNRRGAPVIADHGTGVDD